MKTNVRDIVPYSIPRQLSVGNLHQETQLAALRKKIQDTETQRDTAQTQLETMIDELRLEASL
jgi:hypothetical protein